MLTRWEKIKAVQRKQDFIEAHLTEPITLNALARAARYSPWYAARLFKEATGREEGKPGWVGPGRLASHRLLQQVPVRSRSGDLPSREMKGGGWTCHLPSGSHQSRDG